MVKAFQTLVHAVCIFMGVSFLVVAPANASELPEVIINGIEAYHTQGPQAAIKAWIKGGPLEGSQEVLKQVLVLRKIQLLCGAIKGHHLLDRAVLSPTAHIYYIQLDFGTCPMFGSFLAYKVKQDWVLVQFKFNTKPEEILPEVLTGKRCASRVLQAALHLP